MGTLKGKVAVVAGATRGAGRGIAVAIDHLDSAAVAKLAERIRTEHGHLDVLVNDIWGGELLKGGPADWNTPIWKHDLEKGLRILRLAIDTHLITSHHRARCGREPRAAQPAVAHLGAARDALRLHRPRRLEARRVALHGGP
ncbi:MAG TPA: hypothetical protein VGD87_03975 [Archangium sp.]